MSGAAASPEALLALAQGWRLSGHGVALATVVETWGSAPRPPGSLLAIRDDGLFEGSVSGGCVEGEVIAQARALLASGTARPVEARFGVSNATAFAAGLACGGTIRILIEPVIGDGPCTTPR